MTTYLMIGVIITILYSLLFALTITPLKPNQIFLLFLTILIWPICLIWTIVVIVRTHDKIKRGEIKIEDYKDNEENDESK